MIFVDHLPSHITPVFFLFEDGEFAEQIRRKHGHAQILEMSARVATSSRERLNGSAVIDSLLLALRLSRKLKRAGVDVVLTNSMKSHIVGSLAAKIAGLPCVNFVHDLPTGKALFLLREASRFFANERLTCAPSVARNLRLPHTTAINTPIDLERYRSLPPAGVARRQLGIPDDGLPLVGLVGRIARWKGQDRFIRIAAEARTLVDCRYAIVGSPIFGCEEGYVDEVHALVESLGLQDRFHFIPWQSDLTNVYAALQVLCNCSEREPLGRTICEAMASSVPVVCFEDSGMCDVFTPAEGITPISVGDDSAFARAVASLCGDGEKAAVQAAAASRAVSRLDAEKLSEAFAAILTRVSGKTEQLVLPATRYARTN